MTKFWILSGNSSRAMLFRADGPSEPLVEIAQWDNPEARARQLDLADDKPGRVYDSHGQGRHAVEMDTAPKTREQLRFASQLAAELEKGRVEHAFDKLVLVAAPGFLGQLRAQFHDPLRDTIALEIDKDYTALGAQGLRERLPQRL
jgi:protein required for attachment to host cells